jgi:hypothetical protein
MVLQRMRQSSAIRDVRSTTPAHGIAIRKGGFAALAGRIERLRSRITTSESSSAILKRGITLLARRIEGLPFSIAIRADHFVDVNKMVAPPPPTGGVNRAIFSE